GTWFISRYKFGRDEHTFLGNRVDGYSFYFLFYFKTAEMPNRYDLSILQMLGNIRKEGCYKFGSFLNGITRSL
ncbi:hypothetical protein EZS27_035199, partial [termite gut metagenome]